MGNVEVENAQVDRQKLIHFREALHPEKLFLRIFVSSTFEDLKEHRTAAIRILRQLGHEVLAMEDLVAASTLPLQKVLDMVDRSEAYVGIFAWRYGYVPGRDPAPGSAPTALAPLVEGAQYGQTSITHYEYLRALQRKLPVMAFLLDEQCPWPPQLVDGFDVTRPNAPANASSMRTLRQQLQQERVVSWFTTPADLEARVSAAVTMAGLTRQLDLQLATALDPNAGVAGDSSGEFGITNAIISAGDQQRALKIDLATTWWSTRLYLIAALAEHLTEARRIIIVHTGARVTETVDSPLPNPIQLKDERFIGQLSTRVIVSTLGPMVTQLKHFEAAVKARSRDFNDVLTEINDLLQHWYASFGDSLGQHANEAASKVVLTPEILRRWFGEAMLEQPVHIADLQRASVVDLLRLLDYPNRYIPVLTRRAPATEGDAPREAVDVMDKDALNARLARSYLLELMDRARIS